MSNSKRLTLGEVCNFVGGSQPPKKVFSKTKLKGYVRLIQIRDYKTDSIFNLHDQKIQLQNFATRRI